MNYFGVAIALKAGKQEESHAVAAAANESIRRAQRLGSDCPVGKEAERERYWTEETQPLAEAKKTAGVEPKMIMEYVHELASQKTIPAPVQSVAGLAAKLGIRENEPSSAGQSADAETRVVASQNEQVSEAAEPREGNAVNSFADAAADAQVAQSPPVKPTTPVRSDRDLGELELIMRDVAALRLSSDRLDARLAEISIFKRVNRTYRNHEPRLSQPILNLR